MKKLIALSLTLVAALAIATPAFAKKHHKKHHHRHHAMQTHKGPQQAH